MADRTKPKYSEKKKKPVPVPLCPPKIPHKWPEIKPGRLWLQAGNEPAEPRHGPQSEKCSLYQELDSNPWHVLQRAASVIGYSGVAQLVGLESELHGSRDLENDSLHLGFL
jgi:hypothetical protein